MANSKKDRPDLPALAIHDTSRGPGLRVSANQCARDVLGAVGPGARVCGMTGGQFSLWDLLDALLDQSGPARVRLATWTLSVTDGDRLFGALESGRITDLEVIVDRSFRSRHPKYAARLIESYGVDRVRISSVHAKFILIDSLERAYVVQTSMNFNRNTRVETFDVTEDREMLALWDRAVDRIWGAANRGLTDDGNTRRNMKQALASAPGVSRDGPADAEGKTTETPTGGVSSIFGGRFGWSD